MSSYAPGTVPKTLKLITAEVWSLNNYEYLPLLIHYNNMHQSQTSHT